MRYCEKCYAAVGEEDVVCGKCGAVLRPQTSKVFAEKHSDESPIDEKTDEISATETAECDSEFVTDEEETVSAEGTAECEEQPVSDKNEDKPQTAPVMGIGQWLLTLLLCAIPVVNLVMLIIWVGTEKNINKRNFAAAQLIWIGIMLVISLITAGCLAVFAASISIYHGFI